MFKFASRIAATVAATAAIAIAAPASAQDFGAMINQQMAAMNNMLAGAQQQANGFVQQRMQDPQVQASYRAYVAKARAQGMPVQDFPSYTYDYIRTGGFSAPGMAAARAADNANTARVGQAAADLRNAQANRAAAIAGLNNGFSNNNREFGNQLMGNSTFVAPNGQQMVLPHTWQANGTYTYNGGYYHVDQSGNYYVLGSDRRWYPLRR